MKLKTFSLICGTVFAKTKYSVDIDTDKLVKYAGLIDDWANENTDDLVDMTQGVLEFDALSKQYGHRVQAESKKAFKPFVDNVQMYNEMLPEAETCDGVGFVECLAVDNVVLTREDFNGTCVKTNGCRSLFDFLTKEEQQANLDKINANNLKI